MTDNTSAQQSKRRTTQAPPARLAYTRRSAAAALDLSIATVKRLEASGRLQSVRVGGQRLILADSLASLVRGEAA